MQRESLRICLAQLLETHFDEIVASWIRRTDDLNDYGRSADSGSTHRQASELIMHIADGLARPIDDYVSISSVEDSWQRRYPELFRASAVISLVDILAGHLSVSPSEMLREVMLALAAAPVPLPEGNLFSERLAGVTHMSWSLNQMPDQDAIFKAMLLNSPQLVDADSAAIWLWDADMREPVMRVTESGSESDFLRSASMINLIRQACASGTAFSVDAGETDSSWPFNERATAFIPLQTKEGCLGVLTIHHRPGKDFSHDDVLLLSILGSLAAIAISNSHLRESERHLVYLLQSSIQQVVKASSGRTDKYGDFVHSLLHVAAGMTKASAVCALIDVDERPGHITAVSGSLPSELHPEVEKLARNIRQAISEKTDTYENVMANETGIHASLPHINSYATSEIRVGGKAVGIIVVLGETPFTDDQRAFLRTIAEQIGIGMEQINSEKNIQRLLFELSNVNYVSEEIAGTFDRRSILSVVSQAAGQAMHAPIIICGWCEEDGTISIIPDTVVGVSPEMISGMRLTDNHFVIRTVLSTRADVSSRSIGNKASGAFPVLNQAGLTDWVCVPMIVKPRARGVMLVGDTRPRVFSTHEIAVISTYANQAALAMENSLLYEQIEQQLQQMDILFRVTSLLGLSLDMHEILRILLLAAIDALKVDAGIVTTAEGDSDAQRITAVIGISDKWVGVDIASGEGIIGAVAQRGTPIISTNIARDGRALSLREIARSEDLIGSLTVPMPMQGGVIGTLTIMTKDLRAFTPAHEQLIQTMATQASVAIQNARLFSNEQKHSEELSALLGDSAKRVHAVVDFIAEMLAAYDDSQETSVHIARRNLEAITSVQENVHDDNPREVDLKDTITHMVSTRFADPPKGQGGPDIRITGAHLSLSHHAAMAVALLINECLRAVLETRYFAPGGIIVIAFLQMGKDIIVQIEVPTNRLNESPALKPGIMKMASDAIEGTLTESIEGNLYRLRCRFSRPLG